VPAQAFEAWQAHGAWLEQAKPSLGPGVSDRFKMAGGITREECNAASAQRQL
jgi:amidase